MTKKEYLSQVYKMDKLRKRGLKLKTEHIFPLLLIAINIIAAVIYFIKGEIKMGIYWIAAAVLNVCVTF